MQGIVVHNDFHDDFVLPIYFENISQLFRVKIIRKQFHFIFGKSTQIFFFFILSGGTFFTSNLCHSQHTYFQFKNLSFMLIAQIAKSLHRFNLLVAQHLCFLIRLIEPNLGVQIFNSIRFLLAREVIKKQQAQQVVVCSK